MQFLGEVTEQKLPARELCLPLANRALCSRHSAELSKKKNRILEQSEKIWNIKAAWNHELEQPEFVKY